MVQATFRSLNTQFKIAAGGIVIKLSLDIKDLIISILNSRKAELLLSKGYEVHGLVRRVALEYLD